MNFTKICRTKQRFTCFQNIYNIRLQCSGTLMKVKFSTRANNAKSYRSSHGLFTQKIPYNNGSPNFNKINLSQSFAINKIFRSITTIQNDTNETSEMVEILPSSQNVDSAAIFTDIAEPATSDTIVETALKIGDFKAMGLVNFTPVGLIEGFFEFLHVSTGLPWWGTIALATLILRLGFFPLLIKNQKNVSKLMEMQPKIEKVMEEIKKARSAGDQYTAMNKTVEMQQLYMNNNINPFNSLLIPLIQMPFFISFFMALKKMSELRVPGFENGGILWFKDLTAPDPYLALPILVSAGFILMLELGTDGRPINSSQGKGIKWVFRGLSVVSVFFTMELPSSVLFYFLCANVLAFTQSGILRNKKFQKYFGLPSVKTKINDVKSKSFLEQWKEWDSKQQTAPSKMITSKNKKYRSRL